MYEQAAHNQPHRSGKGLFTENSLITPEEKQVCLTALLARINQTQAGEMLKQQLASCCQDEVPGKVHTKYNYTELGAIRWIRASPFKSHFGPFIMLGALNRDCRTSRKPLRSLQNCTVSTSASDPLFLAPVIK